MYCSSCGSEVQEGLRYCNRCGASLAAETAPPRLLGIVIVLALAVLLVGIVGLAAIFMFAVELMGRGNVPIETVIFLVVFALVVFGIEALLIRQFSRVLGIYLKQGSAPTAIKSETKSSKQITEAQAVFVAHDSLHTTASEEKTRRLESEEETRKLD
jgi:predicted nucleic acid-binding Zn ribbon protein